MSDPAAGQAGIRTALAWRRTALSVAVAGLLTVRLAGSLDGPAAAAAGAAALSGLAALVALAYRCGARARQGHTAGRGPALFVLGTVGYALLGAALVMLAAR